jgi:F-type H+-transporting ATPase subunit c
MLAFIGIGLAMGLAALGIGLGQGWIASSGLSSIARQPEKANDIRVSMIIALAFPELLFFVLFALFGFILKIPAAPAP